MPCPKANGMKIEKIQSRHRLFSPKIPAIKALYRASDINNSSDLPIEKMAELKEYNKGKERSRE